MSTCSSVARYGLSKRFIQMGIGLMAMGTPIWPAYADKSPFDFPESEVQSSPSEAKKFKLANGESVTDFDVAPTRPEAAVNYLNRLRRDFRLLPNFV